MPSKPAGVVVEVQTPVLEKLAPPLSMVGLSDVYFSSDPLRLPGYFFSAGCLQITYMDPLRRS